MPTNTKALQVAEPAGFVAGKNKIINGDFGVWQRGTSATFSGSAATYVGTDRWWNYAAATCTVSRQTADTTGATYGARFGRNSGQTNTGVVYLEIGRAHV